MDAFLGYNQIRLYDMDQEKTTFYSDQGLCCYNVMPFRLKKVGAIYQWLVNKVFKFFIGKTME